MKVKVLASGSKGNTTLISTSNTSILIDVGCNMPFYKSLINLNEIDGVLVTHNHSDHIKGLKQFNKKYCKNIYIQNEKILNIEEYENIVIGEKAWIKDLEIEFLTLSHDVACSGMIIKEKDKELVYITDTGYINSKILSKIKNKEMYIIESNHDETLLMEGSRPFILKQRILSDKGHLSNKSSSKYMNSLVGDKTKKIILAHLSEDNNTDELALKEYLKYENLKNKKIYIAHQHEALEEVEV